MPDRNTNFSPSTLARWRLTGRIPQAQGSPEDIIAATLYRSDPQVCGVREKAGQIAQALRAAGMLRA